MISGEHDHIVRQRNLTTATSKTEVMDYLNFRDYLYALYHNIKTNRNSYSFKKFSEDLGLSFSNALWLILKERRRFSDGSVSKVLARLNLSYPDKKYFVLMVQADRSEKAGEKEYCLKEMMRLKSKRLPSATRRKEVEYCSAWYHAVIREMIRIKSFRADPKWIAEHFLIKISQSQIQESLRLLTSLGLIQWNKMDEQFEISEKQIIPDPSIAPVVKAGYHHDICELTKSAILKIPAKERDLNVMTVAIDEKNIPAVKSILRKACEDILSLDLEAGNPERVFQVNVNFFPLMRKNSLS